MKNEELIAAEMLSWLSYDETSGHFYWIKNPRGQAKMDRPAGSVDDEGYRRIRLKGKAVRAHRLAWFFAYGELPPEQIDHKDGNRDNNAISNLRCCLPHENQQNWPVMATNTTGSPGVCFAKQAGKYVAYIMHKRRRFHLGYFNDQDDAALAYVNAKAALHKFNPTVRSHP